MWVSLAFLSAFFLGWYDISKKTALKDNAVIPVLFLNTLFCSLMLSPLLVLSKGGLIIENSILFVPDLSIEEHFFVFIKSIIVLTSWIFGFFAIKHLPLSIVGPINATRPVMSLVGAFLIFNERLNLYQWIGVLLTVASIFLLSSSSKKEGINFKKNKWMIYLFLATVLGAASGLYDKHLMLMMSSTAVQFWFNTYQCILMILIMLLIWYPTRKTTTPFKWRWSILAISLFITIADFIYFYALTDPSAMISIVSMIRRSSVIISFAGAAILFRESNLKGKAIDLILIIVGMFFLYLGTK